MLFTHVNTFAARGPDDRAERNQNDHDQDPDHRREPPRDYSYEDYDEAGRDDPALAEAAPPAAWLSP